MRNLVRQLRMSFNEWQRPHSVLSMAKSRRLQRRGNVVRMKAARNMRRILVVKPLEQHEDEKRDKRKILRCQLGSYPYLRWMYLARAFSMSDWCYHRFKQTHILICYKLILIPYKLIFRVNWTTEEASLFHIRKCSIWWDNLKLWINVKPVIFMYKYR
jgi:hypothetical protein